MCTAAWANSAHYPLLGMTNARVAAKHCGRAKRSRITRIQISTNVCSQGGCFKPPWILVFSTEFLVKLFMGMFSGSRNPMVIVKIFYPYRVTLKLKVIAFVHGCGATPWPSLSRSWSGSTAFIHRFSNSLIQKNIDIDTKITFLEYVSSQRYEK